MNEPSPDVLVVGAGVAGLTCARDLQRSGKSVAVLDRGRSVGGRCSTWRADNGHLLDYGVTFFHGSDRSFLAELDQLDGIIEGWPRRTRGRGDPCQPRALAAHERRVGLTTGVSALPKHLATDLDIRVATTVEGIGDADGHLTLELSDGSSLTASTVVLALACEQTRDLLRSLAETDPEIGGIRRLLAMLGTVPCLTVMGTYDSPRPDWHLMLPDASDSVQLITNESSKRDVPGCALTIQARPGWSAAHIENPPEDWAAELLREAAPHVGDWVTSPTWSRPHRWRYARTDLATELAEPILLQRNRSQLGLIGELFARGAGVEAAYLAGRALARRIAGESHD